MMNRAIAAALLAACLAAPPALAGPAQIRDAAALLSPSDRAAVEDAAEKSPFTVRVITVAGTRDDAELGSLVASAVTAPEVLAVALDSGRRVTMVMGGGATGIPPGNDKSLADRGAKFFKRGNFGQGVAAIVLATAQLRAVAPVVLAVPPVDVSASRSGDPPTPQALVVTTTAQVAPPIEKPAEGHPWLWALLLVGSTGGAAWWFVSRRRREYEALEEKLADGVIQRDDAWRALDERPKPATPLMPPTGRAAVPSRPPAAPTPRKKKTKKTREEQRGPGALRSPPHRSSTSSTTVINSGGGVGDLATGVLLGQALSGGGRDRVIEREVVREVPSYRSPPARSWDDEPAPKASSWDSFVPAAPSWEPAAAPDRSSSWDSPATSEPSSSNWDSVISDAVSSVSDVVSSSWD